MTPAGLLALAVGVTVVAYIVEGVRRHRSGEALRRLATRWRMNFSLTDRLRLTSRVARHFPIPGAANLRISNVIYGTDHDRYRYIFTTEYTVGAVGTKQRLTRAGTFSEPRDRETGDPPTPVELAPLDVPLIEQYTHLAQGLAAPVSQDNAAE